MRCSFAKVGTDCLCVACIERNAAAERMVDRGVDMRDVVPSFRPWILKVREERTRIRSAGVGGCSGPVETDGGPWHENAVGELEDFDDGTETA